MDRFSEAPEGYLPGAVRLQIGHSIKFLYGTVKCRSTVSYTIVRNLLLIELEQIAVRFCYALEEKGITAISMVIDDYDYYRWDVPEWYGYMEQNTIAFRHRVYTLYGGKEK